MTERQTTNLPESAPEPSPRARATRMQHAESGTPPERAAGDAREPSPDDPAEPMEEREPASGWPPRDFLAPFVLLAVSLQRAHGYVIEDYLRALGVFGITMSTLYRTLRQMERDGFLESTWEPGPTGPARRVYTITDAGHDWLDASAATLTAYRATIDRFFGLYDAGPGARRHPPDEPDAVKEKLG